MAVFALRQHHAGEEGAECRGQPHELHQQRDAHHHHQCEADEHLAHACFGHEAEQRAREEAPGQHHHGDGGKHGNGLGPARQVADERGVMRVMRLGGGEQRQQGEDGDDRDVLEQQHGEARLPGGGLEDAALIEALQHDSGRRHGQDQAGGQCGLPAEAHGQRAAAQRQRGDDNLQPAQPDDGAAQLPQLRGLQFEADEEQHDDNAEFGEVHDMRALLADEAEQRRADDHARHQIAQHRTEPETGCHRSGNDGGGKIDEGAEEKILRVHRLIPSAKAGGSVKPGASRVSGSMVPSRRPTIRSR